MSRKMLYKLVNCLVLTAFLTIHILPVSNAKANALNLPVPGTMVLTSPAFMPVMMKGLRIHPDNPLLFDFILDSGNSGLPVNGSQFKDESSKLINYFLASLTVKDSDQWVNLSPYEKDKITSEDLGKTALGRDMLAQDYMLKQITASMIYPEKELGREFWNRVYSQVQQRFGNQEIPVNTFNKVWIVADKAKVIERNNTAYVIDGHLKVMLEEDYLALSKNSAKNSAGHQLNVVAQIVREIVIPQIEQEVNKGEHFAPLRQIFYSMILATWYKKSLKQALLNQVYSNQGKTAGTLANDPTINNKIYTQYLEAYKKGVFNYIKEDLTKTGQKLVARKYFSGGIPANLRIDSAMQVVGALLPSENRQMVPRGDLAMASVRVDRAMAGSLEGIARALFGFVDAMHVRPLIEHDLNQQETNDMLMLAFHGNNYGTTQSAFLTLARFGGNDALEKLKVKLQTMSPTSGLFEDHVLEQGDYPRLNLAIKAIAFLEEMLGVSQNKRLASQWLSDEDINKLYNHFKGKFIDDQGYILAVYKEEYFAKLFSLGASEINLMTDDNKVDPRGHGGGSFQPRELETYQIGISVPQGNRKFAVVFNEAGFRNFIRFLSMADSNLANKLLSETDAAMISGDRLNKVQAHSYQQGFTRGGVDLNAKNMALDVDSSGKAIEFKFDPAMVAEFKKGNFAGVEGVILRIVPITSPLPLLGLSLDPAEDRLAKS